MLAICLSAMALNRTLIGIYLYILKKNIHTRFVVRLRIGDFYPARRPHAFTE